MKVFSFVLDLTGLDTLRFLIGNRAIKDQDASSDPAKTKKKVEKITNKHKIEFAIKYSEDQLNRVEDRNKTIQTKAFTLMSAAGLSTSFIVGFSSLLLNQESVKLFPYSVCISMALFVFTVFSLLVTVLFAIRSVWIARYSFPSIDDVYLLSELSLNEAKREYLSTLIQSFENNDIIVNSKTTYLNCAQIWFRNSLIALFLISLIIR